MGKRPKAGKHIDSPIISDGFGDIGHCQYGWTIGGTNACFRRPTKGTEFCAIHGAEHVGRDDGGGGGEQMVERAIEGEAEQDAQAQEDAEEVLCDGVARDIIGLICDEGWTLEGDSPDYETAVRALSEVVKDTRCDARIGAPTFVGDDTGRVWEFTAPIEEVNASLRAAGGDPEAIGREGRHLVDALLKVRKLQDEVVEHCENLNDERERCAALAAALVAAHACATLRADGTCDGCAVSEALAVWG